MLRVLLLLALLAAAGPVRASQAPSPDPVPADDAEPLDEGSDAPGKRRVEFAFRPSGHLKGFTLASFPYESDLLPDTPIPQAILDGRLNLAFEVGDVFTLEAAHAITTFITPSGGISGAGAAFGSGVGIQAPEAIPLTWTAFDEDDPPDAFRVQGRTDRLLARVSVPHVDLTLGRQPISFGSGLFFTPLDLVNPFTPATVDTEYKPGVDAFRVDGYLGFAGRITAVAAYAGSWDEDGVTAALYGQSTFGVTDLGLFYGFVQGDHVVGATMVSALGPVGVHADATVTVPNPDLDEPVFFRGVVGADGRPTGTTTILGEIYVQTLQDGDTSDLFTTLQTPRYARGEVWLGGLAYAGLSVQQEIVPTLNASLGTFVNLTDPSALLAPSLAWSIADEVDAAFGGYVGLGKRPTLDGFLPVAGSEFGTYPATAFVQIRTYF